MKPAYLYPGKPWQNGYLKNFNEKFLDECLDQELLLSRVEDQVVANWWRRIYNWECPHRSLEGGYHPLELESPRAPGTNSPGVPKSGVRSIGVHP